MNVLVSETNCDTTVQMSPIMAVRHGRGRTGGSTFMDYLIQRARQGGRPILIGDGDRRNATLTGLYPPSEEGGASQPETDETPDVKDWIGRLVGRMVEAKVSLVLDLGAGDQVLAEFGRELALPEFCESVGVAPLSIYMIGPDVEDFEHVLTIARAGVFNTRRSLLVMNESLVRAGKTPRGAFDHILARPELEEMEEAGARIVMMPRILYFEQVRKAGLRFFDAAAGKRGKQGRPLDALAQFALKNWLDQMERQFQDIGVTEWLP
jgi:hypothetical protein